MGIGFNTNTSTFPFIAPFSDNSLTEKVFSWKHCRGKSSEIKENQEKSRKLKENQENSSKNHKNIDLTANVTTSND